MLDRSPCACNEVHTRAICDEVGERLRILLDRTQTPTPPRLLALLLRLQLNELQAARSDSAELVPKSKSAA